MARIFMTGLESGAATVFANAASAAISTTQKRTGAYSFNISATNGGADMPWGSSISEGYIRFGVYLTKASDVVAFLVSSDGNRQITLGYVAATKAMTLRNNGTTVLATSTVLMELNTWYCIELYFKIENSGGRATLKINGETGFDFTGDTLYSAQQNVASIRWGYKSGWSEGTAMYIDDIAINDTTGAVNNSWIGQGGIRPVLVNADGTVTGLTPSTGSDNYALVDEVPASDADYVSGSTPDDYDLYTVDDSAMPAAGSVSAVKWNARAKVTEDAANITPVIRSESTTEQQADIPLSTSFTVKELIMDVDPIDDAAWSIAKIAALEIGAAVG